MATPADPQSSGSVHLLISMLVRFPEVASLDFDPAINHLRFTFLCAGRLDEPEAVQLHELLIASVEAYGDLEGIEPQTIRFTHESLDGHSVLELERDVDTLTPSEISLVVGLLRDRLESRLLAEESQAPAEEEEQTHQDELIESLLDDLRGTRPAQRLIAFREEGRVLVFNK